MCVCVCVYVTQTHTKTEIEAFTRNLSHHNPNIRFLRNQPARPATKALTLTLATKAHGRRQTPCCWRPTISTSMGRGRISAKAFRARIRFILTSESIFFLKKKKHPCLSQFNQYTNVHVIVFTRKILYCRL